MTTERNVKGLLGTKLGMTQTWDENNRVVPVTVVAAGTNVVTQVRSPETDGYNGGRHGFAGVSASHGAHRNHRKPGSIGGCATPGRVFKGLRMAGQMGGVAVTTQNITVHSVDVERGLVLLKGAVPGAKGSLLVIRTAA